MNVIKLRLFKTNQARTLGSMEMLQLLCLFLITVLSCGSCLYTRTANTTYTVSKNITIEYGSAILDINGRLNENIYWANPFSATPMTTSLYDSPLINEGTITKNEIKYLSSGEEYSFSVLPTEVVSVNIRSLDENDVEISVFEYGQRRKYTIKGTDRMGLFLSFQNR